MSTHCFLVFILLAVTQINAERFNQEFQTLPDTFTTTTPKGIQSKAGTTG